MNRIIILFFVVITVTLSGVGCKKEKLPVTADLSVTCTALEGHDVELNNLRAELHSTATYDNLKYNFQINASAAGASGQITELIPGRYFLVVWRDNDNDQKFSKGDFFGFYPYALDLKAGDKKALKVEMYIVD